MLRLELLGGFRAHASGTDLAALAKQPRRAGFLAYLAVEREVPRDRLVSLMWPDADPDRGRHSLNQTVYYLRRLIGADLVELRGDQCVVAPSVRTDVDDLEAAAARKDDVEVLRLYGGPLLAGTGIAPTAEFEMWLDRRSAALERMHRAARLRRLDELLIADKPMDALRCAEEWCRLSPLEDEAQHRYIELLAETGQRGAALRQYGSYRRLLEEQELRPLDETVALVEQLQRGEVGALAMAEEAPRPRTERALDGRRSEEDRAASDARDIPRPVRTRRGLSGLLAAVFLFNLAETTIESWLEPRVPAITTLRLHLARAAQGMEGPSTFDYHELTNRVAVIGYSTLYYLAFPTLLVVLGVMLARRPSIRPYRVYSLSLVAAYLLSLPFFLAYPIPERWWYSESGAIVLSDLWSVHLIDMFRPFSGLDNSFPSTHASLTTIAVLVAFAFGARFRWSLLFIGIGIVLSTFVLGIHWLMDILAGIATGVVSFWIARRLDARFRDDLVVKPRMVRTPEAPVPDEAPLILEGRR